jgi:hypothetical protein
MSTPNANYQLLSDALSEAIPTIKVSDLNKVRDHLRKCATLSKIFFGAGSTVASKPSSSATSAGAVAKRTIKPKELPADKDRCCANVWATDDVETMAPKRCTLNGCLKVKGKLFCKTHGSKFGDEGLHCHDCSEMAGEDVTHDYRYEHLGTQEEPSIHWTNTKCMKDLKAKTLADERKKTSSDEDDEVAKPTKTTASKAKGTRAPRGKSGYNVFMAEMSAFYKDEVTTEGFSGKEANTERMRRISAAWKALSEEEQGEYNDRAASENEEAGKTPLKKTAKPAVKKPASKPTPKPSKAAAVDDEEDEVLEDEDEAGFEEAEEDEPAPKPAPKPTPKTVPKPTPKPSSKPATKPSSKPAPKSEPVEEEEAEDELEADGGDDGDRDQIEQDGKTYWMDKDTKMVYASKDDEDSVGAYDVKKAKITFF